MAQATAFLLGVAAFLAALALVLGRLLKTVQISRALGRELSFFKKFLSIGNFLPFKIRGYTFLIGRTNSVFKKKPFSEQLLTSRASF
jgi:hypothetical protein